MIEEVIEPYLDNMKRLGSLGMLYEEMRYCMGIASGLQQFEDEATTGFKDWTADMAGNMAGNLISQSKKSCNDPKLRTEMESFEDSSYTVEDEDNGDNLFDEEDNF